MALTFVAMAMHQRMPTTCILARGVHGSNGIVIVFSGHNGVVVVFVGLDGVVIVFSGCNKGGTYTNK